MEKEQRIVQPIKPGEILDKQAKQITDPVLNAFNTLITKNFHGDSAEVMVSEVVSELKRRKSYIKDSFKKGLLDVGSVYMEAGWQVKYKYATSFTQEYFTFTSLPLSKKE